MAMLDKLKAAGGIVVIGAFAAGVIAWGGFNWALEATNREGFCISRHEMKENVFK